MQIIRRLSLMALAVILCALVFFSQAFAVSDTDYGLEKASITASGNASTISAKEIEQGYLDGMLFIRFYDDAPRDSADQLVNSLGWCVDDKHSCWKDNDKLLNIVLPEDVVTSEAIEMINNANYEFVEYAFPNWVFSQQGVIHYPDNLSDEYASDTADTLSKKEIAQGYHEGQLYLRMNDDATWSQATTAALRLGMDIDRKKTYWKEDDKLVFLKCRDSSIEVSRHIASINSRNYEGVKYAFPNWIFREADVIDSRVDTEASLESTQSFVGNEGNYFWQLDKIGAPDAWKVSQCAAETTVAVLDSGVDFSHPALENYLDTYHAWDCVDNCALTGYRTDHGTAVSGVISSESLGAPHSLNVSAGAKILPVNIVFAVQDDVGYSDYCYIKAGIEYVSGLGIDGLRVINISMAGPENDDVLDEFLSSEFAYATVVANNAGISIVGAGGNDDAGTAMYPADTPGIVSVVSTDRNDVRDSCNYGPGKDISAPGVDVPVLVPGGYGVTSSGTSFAAPVVSGVLALMFAFQPSMTVAQAEQILYDTAVDLGAPGRDDYYGYGRVDAAAALDACADLTSRTSLEHAQVSGVHVVYWYTGYAIQPVPTVMLSGLQLVNGVDYRVVYHGNCSRFDHTGYATIVGMGNYYGAITFEYDIQGRWHRISGDDAFSTAAAMALHTFGSTGADTAVVATIGGYWDALTAAGLAGLCDAPVLLTGQDYLPSATAEAIEELDVSEVYVMGGTAAVSNQVASSISSISGVESVVRIAGDSAISTAIDVFETGADIGSGWGSTCIVSTINTFQDAMSASPFSFASHAPVFLTNYDGSLDDATVSAVRSGGFTRVVICGGVLAVSTAVERQLSGLQIVRLSGDDCYETSVRIAEFCVDEGFDESSMAVATGASYYDGLCASSTCGMQGMNGAPGMRGMPLLLIHEDFASAALGYCAQSGRSIDFGLISGGVAAVPESLREALELACAR